MFPGWIVILELVVNHRRFNLAPQSHQPSAVPWVYCESSAQPHRAADRTVDSQFTSTLCIIDDVLLLYFVFCLYVLVLLLCLFGELKIISQSVG